jgi:hypothetical protein
MTELAELLGMMVDCSIRTKLKPRRHGEKLTGVVQTEFYCVFCMAIGDTPPKVQHKDGCLVARATKLLNEQSK